MADEPDILEAYPDLLAIAERHKTGIYLSENVSRASDIATCLNELRSLIQQTLDLRCEEGELEYAVDRLYPLTHPNEEGDEELSGYHRERHYTFSSYAEALAYAEKASLTSRLTHEVVVIRTRTLASIKGKK